MATAAFSLSWSLRMSHATSGKALAFEHSWSLTVSQILLSPASHSSAGTFDCFEQIKATAAFSLSWSLRMSHATSGKAATGGRAATVLGHLFFTSVSQKWLNPILHSIVGTLCCFSQIAATVRFSKLLSLRMSHPASGKKAARVLGHSFSATVSQTLLSPASHSSAGTFVCFEQIKATAAFSLSWSLRMSQATSGKALAFG